MAEEEIVFVDVSTPDTPAYKIFHKPFETQVQRMHLLTKSDMGVFGVPVSGDRNVDNAALREWIWCRSTIWEMVEYHSKGIQFIINVLEDSVEIYELLNKHLKAHHDKVFNNINLGEVPIDDLMKMDAFAAVVFNLAKQYRKPEELTLPAGLRSLLERGPKMGAGIKPDPIVENTSEPVEPKHHPIATQIAKHFQERTKPKLPMRGRPNAF